MFPEPAARSFFIDGAGEGCRKRPDGRPAASETCTGKTLGSMFGYGCAIGGSTSRNPLSRKKARVHSRMRERHRSVSQESSPLASLRHVMEWLLPSPRLRFPQALITLSYAISPPGRKDRKSTRL